MNVQLDNPRKHGKWRLDIVDPETGRKVGKLKSFWVEETQCTDTCIVMGCTFFVTKDGGYLVDGIMGDSIV